MTVSPAPGRILMTTDTVGGVFSYAAELAAMLDRAGVEVLLATMGAPLTTAQTRLLSEIPRLKIFESHFRLEWMEDAWRDVDAAGDWLLEIENATRPDLVHVNGFAHGALHWRAPSIVVGHSCIFSWWRAVRGESPPDRMDEYRRRVRRGLRHAAMVVAPSQAMLDALSENYGSFERGRVIYNGRAPSDFVAVAKEPFVFSMGRLWDAAKNVAVLDAAAADLAWPVIVAGSVRQDGSDGPEESLRPKNARSIGVLEPAAVRHVLARAAIYAHPARYEPFGLSILEAALSGCALVLGDIPSLRELWSDAAIFVPPDDARALSRELAALVDDEERRSELSARARRAASRFTPERMVSEYLAAYRQVAGTAVARREEERSVCA